MYVINFWHKVLDYDEWKKVFDSDPLDREGSGVRRYMLTRPDYDAQMVVGELEFDRRDEADAFARRLREVWQGRGRDLIASADMTICEVLEQKQLGAGSQRRAA